MSAILLIYLLTETVSYNFIFFTKEYKINADSKSNRKY